MSGFLDWLKWWIGPRGEHMGSIGLREIFTLTVTSKREMPSGDLLHKFKDAEGRIATWFATTDSGLEVGKTYTLRATVSDHVVFQKDRETQLTRVMINKRDKQPVNDDD